MIGGKKLRNGWRNIRNTSPPTIALVARIVIDVSKIFANSVVSTSRLDMPFRIRHGEPMFIMIRVMNSRSNGNPERAQP